MAFINRSNAALIASLVIISFYIISNVFDVVEGKMPKPGPGDPAKTQANWVCICRKFTISCISQFQKAPFWHKFLPTDENFIRVTPRSAHQGPIQITEWETKNETINEISSYIFSFIVSGLLDKNIQKIITRKKMLLVEAIWFICLKN